jgi:hypothetical protein
MTYRQSDLTLPVEFLEEIAAQAGRAVSAIDRSCAGKGRSVPIWQTAGRGVRSH